MKIQFIDRAEMARIWSLKWAILTAALAAVPVAYMTLPPDWLPTIPLAVKSGLAVATLVSAAGTAAARVIKQPA